MPVCWATTIRGPWAWSSTTTNHVRMEGVTVQNSGFWQIVPYYADDVVIRNVRILAPKSPNTDAIDPFSSSNVVIDHVFSSTGDDNIAIKIGRHQLAGSGRSEQIHHDYGLHVREWPRAVDR